MNACERFVDELMDLAPGTGWKFRFKAAAALIYTVKRNLDLGINSRELDVEGFRKELVRFNQRGQAFRHIRLHAGLILLGPLGWLPSWALHFLDWMQSRKGRPESLTEMEDNRAGQRVGQLMSQGFKGTLPLEALRSRILGVLSA